MWLRMRAFAFAFACLACAGHAHRLHKVSEHIHRSALVEQHVDAIEASRSQWDSQATNPLKAIASLLSASRPPQAGFAGFAPVRSVAPGPASVSDPFSRHHGLQLAPSRSRLLHARMALPLPRTFIMIKPDGVQRSLVGEIIKRFEQRGYQLKGLKLYQASEELLRQHYKDLVEKKFFPSLLSYMLSGPVVCMVWEGVNVVKMGRQMLGATNPQESLPGTIRGDFSIEVGRNICHGSDSPENAEREIKLWFKEDELIDWKSHSEEWIYRDYE
mmetsp:Transcript_70279/g.128319  ORF Transcript_70279/g.128319 Transcript_70279/m.128319 type:complete len:272 (+) Transcript_70279:34-849(+)